MPVEELNSGALVEFMSENRAGVVGIVSQPIGAGSVGHVLICDEGQILGVAASLDDVKLADDSSRGFAQLGYNLLNLASHLVEHRLGPLIRE